MVVVIVEPTLADRDRPGTKQLGDRFRIPEWIEVRGVVRMDSGGVMHEPGVCGSNGSRAIRSGDGFADRDDRDRARDAGAPDGFLTISVERWIGEMRVAIDEAHTSEHRREDAAVLAEP
jgi:hypothetical protein